MLEYRIDGSTIHIETTALAARIQTEGYTSGVAAGSLLDKATGMRDVGFGLSIVDFLLEPAASEAPVPPGQYEFGGKFRAVHGDIPKRYVEGPQICTQAKKLGYSVARGDSFIAVRQWFTWHKPYDQYQAGSRWEQTLVFPESARYFLSADRVTTVNDCPAQFFRVDMPGHIKHNQGDSFEHIYLSYSNAMLPCTEFLSDFPPDRANLYQRGKQPVPDQFIRAYQVKREGELGPWLAGMTLEPNDVYEAWCHQRGYVCLIEELGGWPTRAGDTFGAAYVVGWFESVAALHATYDRYRGWSGIDLDGPADRPTGFHPVKQSHLSAVTKRV